jgi:SpoVK/Ycf46/Vps4 family AAA+-type ATPase
MAKYPQNIPFASNLSYLAAQSDYLTLLARWRLVSRKSNEESLAQDDDNGPSPHRGRKAVKSVTAAQVEAARRKLERRIAITPPERMPLEALAKRHGLDLFEKQVLMATLGPSLNDRFFSAMRKLAEARFGGEREIRTILALLCTTTEERISRRTCFVARAPLFANGLLALSGGQEPDEVGEFMRMDLNLPRRVASMLLGEYDVDGQILSYSSVVDPVVDLSQVVLPPGKRDEVLRLVTNRDEFLRARQAWGLDDVMAYGRGMILLFSGPPGTGKTMLAHALAKAAGYRLLLVDFRKIVQFTGRGSFDDSFRRLFQEARLQKAIPFFDEADEMFCDRCVNGAMPTILREIERMDGVCILATNRRQILDEALDRRVLYKLDFDMPTSEQREAIWRSLLPERLPLTEDVNVKSLAEEFEFSGGYIKNAVLCAANTVAQRPESERRVSQADLCAAAVLQRQNRLTVHADQIVPRVSLSDVVVDAGTRAQIDALMCAIRARSRVFATWGFGRSTANGRGIAALFSGPSGTGKTLTAEAVARELGRTLYPVRLDRVVSQYVGETEKHLAEVFKAACDNSAVLFFDEADALFGGRLGDGSHHARYLNQQTNVLLTELERFEGLVLMATNQPESFDSAFARRIRYHVRFSLPDFATRLLLWRKLIPADAPLAEDVRLDELAHDFAFTGGLIRSVVLRAAFEAAASGGPITHVLLRAAAEMEQPLAPVRVTMGFKISA